MAILRTIWWFIFFFGSLTALFPKSMQLKRMKQEGKDAQADPVIAQKVTWWAQSLLNITGATVTVKGKENLPTEGAVMFTPNHQSNYDIPLMLTQLGYPHALVAKIETDKIPMVRTWMRLIGCVFLDRKNPRQAILAMREAGELLEKGKSVVVFPEGTRSQCDTLGTFKNGAFKTACKAGVPIVPIAIDGSYRLMEANKNLMKPAHVTLTILPAIETKGLDREAQKQLPDIVAQQIANAKNNN